MENDYLMFNILLILIIGFTPYINFQWESLPKKTTNCPLLQLSLTPSVWIADITHPDFFLSFQEVSLQKHNQAVLLPLWPSTASPFSSRISFLSFWLSKIPLPLPAVLYHFCIVQHSKLSWQSRRTCSWTTGEGEVAFPHPLNTEVF